MADHDREPHMPPGERRKRCRKCREPLTWRCQSLLPGGSGAAPSAPAWRGRVECEIIELDTLADLQATVRLGFRYERKNLDGAYAEREEYT